MLFNLVKYDVGASLTRTVVSVHDIVKISVDYRPNFRVMHYLNISVSP